MLTLRNRVIKSDDLVIENGDIVIKFDDAGQRKTTGRRANMEFYPLSELEAKTNPEVLAKARKIYEQESLGFWLEITALPKTDNAEKEVLLKTV